MDVTIIRSVEALREIYGEPSPTSIVKVTKSLTPEYRRMIEASPFLALATVGPEGLDCSPRGDLGGIVRVADESTILLPDWRGNNRVDSLVNIVRDPRVALMFLVPGSVTTMRVNGRAVVSVDPALLASFVMDGKNPRTVVEVRIDEVYFQCARAIVRADLWNPERYAEPASLPTAGAFLKAAQSAFDQEAYENGLEERVRSTLW